MIAPGVPSSASSPERLVDRHEHDVAGRLELRRILAVADPRLHDVDPDRQRRFGAGLAGPDRLLLVVADPHPDRDVGIEPDEPRVGVVVGRAGLAADRPVERRGLRRGAALDDAAQQVGHHEGRVGADRVLRLRAVLLEHVAFAVGDLEDRVRAHADALVREDRVGARHLRSASPPRRRGRRRGTAAAATRGRGVARRRSPASARAAPSPAPRARCAIPRARAAA